MNLHVPERMTVDEFLAWSERQPKGRYELFDGRVVMQQSERWAHVSTKGTVYRLLHEAISKSGLPFYVAMDGPAVRISAATSFEPDGIVAALPMPSPDSFEITNPLLVVEVLSPSTARVDLSLKLAGYFTLPSLAHYLVLDPDDKAVVHYRRAADGRAAEPVTLTEGRIELDPPGIVLDLAELFPAS